jgi:diguanylate cyclase (GGDEF)-like protein
MPVRFRGLHGLLLALALVAGAAPAVHALDPGKAFSHYVRDSWSIQEGLPQISVVAIAQDEVGYIWVGTQGGLARFDGVRFQAYSPESTPELPGIWVRSLLADGDRLWIGTYKGLAVLQQGVFATVPVDDDRLPALDVHALAKAADGTIHAATSEGLFQVKAGRLVALAQAPRPALSLMADAGGLWVGGIGQVERVAAQGNLRLPMPASAELAAVTHLSMVRGRVWAGTSQGLFTLQGSDWQRPDSPAELHAAPVTAMHLDRDGNLWVGSNAGLARFHGDARMELIPDVHPAAFPQVTAIHEDREHNLWLGSQLNGLARLWNGWTRRYSTAEGLHDPIVWSLTQGGDGRLWVGTHDGLSLLREGRFELVVPGSDLPHPHAYNLLADEQQVWIGTRRGLVLWRDGQVHAPRVFAPMANAQINGIVRAADGSHWITTSEGLFHLREGRLQRFARAQGLADPRVRVIAFLRDGRLVAGTQSGLYGLVDGRFHPIGPAQDPKASLDVTSVLELRDGRLVIGTLHERMYVLAEGRWHVLGPEQGMPANSPFFLDEGDDGMLWVAGIRGIGRVPLGDLPGSASARTPVRGEMLLNERGDPKAGQQGYCCNGAGMSKGLRAGSVLWLPSRDGVVAMDTAEIHKNPQPPPVLVERVVTREGSHPPPADGSVLKLPADARDLQFEFTALSYQDPRSLQLKYRLVGYDKDWQTLADATRRNVNYTNLPPGSYVFEVAGSNNADVWNPDPAAVSFQVQPRFHETAMFRLLLAALLAAALYAAWRRQLQQHARQRAALEDEVRVRTRELHAANERLENASQTDPLTGLRNRRYLANQLPADIAYYDREQRRDGASEQVIIFALIDIDHFKSVNDQHGHAVGDLVLQQAGQVLASLVRSGDYLVRWGGEEFLLVFRPMPGHQLPAVGERIRNAFAAHAFEIGGVTPIRITCSVGLAEYPLFRDERYHVGWGQMVELADAALYRVKRSGRNGWAAFRPTARTQLATLLHDLREESGALLASGALELVGSDGVLAHQGPAP